MVKHDLLARGIASTVGESISIVDSKIIDIINVKSFGAIGDGITDDTLALQSVIDSFSSDGGTLFLPSGLIFKNTGLVIKTPNVTITGGGILYGAPLTIGDSTIAYGNNLNILIDNITFQYDAISSNQNGINIVNARKVTITHCKFNNCDKAIYTLPIAGGFHRNGLITINDNFFNVVNYCFYVDNGGSDWQTTNDCHFTNNIANFAMINGIYLKGIDGIIIEENTFFFPSYNTTPSEIENKKQNILIEGVGSDWVHIKNNNLFEAGLEGILASNLKRFSIIGNNIAWNGQRVMSSAIKIIGSQDSQGCINNNTLSLFTKYGVEINTTGQPTISLFGNPMSYSDTNPYYYGNTAPYSNGALTSITHYGTHLTGTSNITGVKVGINPQGVLNDYTGGNGLGFNLNTRSCLTSLNKIVAVTSANTPILNLFDFKGEQTNYDGILKITARNSALNSSNTASYTLDLGKHSGGSGVTLVASNGLTAGGSASHPSFTFTIDTTNNALLASPVGATSATFYFYVTAIHNLKIT